ncbi:MAG: exodeoxyribonuclease VII small subunit [Coriobacteriia bacterium]|nr:exodeoxyribonuclease VII small subunit [Coriobacteriia bacterium]
MEDQSSYTHLRKELEDIVLQVRSKDVPLEKCLDLFDEALRIGGQCAEAIDRTDFSIEEFGEDISEAEAIGIDSLKADELQA